GRQRTGRKRGGGGGGGGGCVSPRRSSGAPRPAARAAATRAARPAWLQHVPDLHGKPDAAPDWSRHLG
ncbi:hypothetical protein ACFV3O_22475, partial [Streptomyces albidoflavus]